jgi:membrane-associated phospholipid phosphatase
MRPDDADHERGAGASRSAWRGWLGDAERLDLAVYSAIADTPTPKLDRGLARLSRAADHSKLSLAGAGALAIAGGADGRRAALRGLASLAVTSVIVNAGLKLAARRRRPDPDAHAVPGERRVRMPATRSFPSGHSAAAFAFATGVGDMMPAAAIPLRALAVAVAYSRVHTGVHYPGDVIVGALSGVTVAELTCRALRRGFRAQD